MKYQHQNTGSNLLFAIRPRERCFFDYEGIPFSKELRIVCIRLHPSYTRVDFSYAVNYMKGKMRPMTEDAHLEIPGCSQHFHFLAELHPPKSYIKYTCPFLGDMKEYSLFFEPLPASTSCVSIIEKEEPGMRNFYAVDFSSWNTQPHPIDLPMQYN